MRVLPAGSLAGHVTAVGGGGTTTANLYADRTGTGAGEPAAVNGVYADWRRNGAQIGSITIVSGTSVAYNQTSDPRSKIHDGPVEAAAARAHQLGRAAFTGRLRDNVDRRPDDIVTRPGVIARRRSRRRATR